MIRYGSLCSGIEAVTVAWHPLGAFAPSFFAEIEAFPSAVLAHHWPAVPNLGDITAPDFLDKAAALGDIDVLVGGTPCFPAGTLVWTARGQTPIEDVEVGDLVLTHLRRWRRVVRTGAKRADTVIVKGMGHHGLETTPDHPFYVSRKGRQWDNDRRAYVRTFAPFDWVKAEDSVGHYWCVASDVAALNVPLPSAEEAERKEVDVGTPGFWWFVGAWLGNGWVSDAARPGHGGHRGTIIVCDGFADATDLGRRLASSGLNFTPVKDRTGIKYTAFGQALVRWLKTHFGSRSGGKKLPSWALGMNRGWRQALLEGYMFTDGNRVKNKSWTTPSISKKLAYGIAALAATLGKAPSLTFVDVTSPKRRTPIIEGRRVNERSYYQVRFNDHPRSSVKLGDYRLGLVRKVLLGRNTTVYNLEVEEDNSYTADNIIAHNCQAFSVAGLRNGLNDARGKLSLVFCAIADAADPRIILWENVPGVLSDKTNGFGCLLAGLAGEDVPLQPPGGKWTDAGIVFGPKRTVCWRLLDAQHFQLAQRRKRVFVVASPTTCGIDPAEVLFEFQGVRRDSPPSREAREEPTGGAERCFGGNNTSGSIDVAPALLAQPGSGWKGDFDSETFIAQCVTGGVTHALKVEGADASEDGTGRGNPTVNVPVYAFQPRIARNGRGDMGDLVNALSAQSGLTGKGDAAPCVAFPANLSGTAVATSEELCPAIGAKNPTGVAYAVHENQRAECTLSETSGVVKCAGGKPGQGYPAPLLAGRVRRLTPTECLRLQGFPVEYTAIMYKGKPAADGPQYKAIGNSMAVNVMRWLGERIAKALENNHG